MLKRQVLTKRFGHSREKSPEKALPFLPSGVVDRNGNTGTFKDTYNNAWIKLYTDNNLS